MKGYGPVRKGKSTRPAPYSVAGQPGAGDDDGDDACMIYVGNLPFSAEWQELKDFFQVAGTVEYARVLSTDGHTISTKGRSRGSGYVKFSTPDEAQNAIDTLNGAEMEGRILQVDSWTGAPQVATFGKGKGKPARKFGGLSETIPAAKRSYQAAKPALMFEQGRKRARPSFDQTSSASCMVYVGNLPFKAEWQELKDHFGQAGAVEYTRILTTDGSHISTKGRSRGCGYVRFATPQDAKRAITMLNGSELEGRNIEVDIWTGGVPPEAKGRGK